MAGLGEILLVLGIQHPVGELQRPESFLGSVPDDGREALAQADLGDGDQVEPVAQVASRCFDVAVLADGHSLFLLPFEGMLLTHVANLPLC